MTLGQILEVIDRRVCDDNGKYAETITMPRKHYDTMLLMAACFVTNGRLKDVNMEIEHIDQYVDIEINRG